MAQHVADTLVTYSRSYGNTRIAALKSFYRWAASEDLLKRNPTAHLRSHKEETESCDPFTTDELTRLVAACQSRFERAVLLMLIGSGVRRSELLDMRVEDVRWIDDAILIHGKGLKQRLVAPGRVAMRALRDHVGLRRDGLVWCSATTDRLTRTALYRFLRRLSREAQVSGVYPHRFRTTTICYLLDAGADLISVSVAAGHANLETTRIYQRAVEGKRALAQQRRYSLADKLVG